MASDQGERGRRMRSEPPRDADASAGDADTDRAGHTLWERRLTRRQKSQRALTAVAAVLVALALVVNLPGALAGAISQAWQRATAPAPPPTPTSFTGSVLTPGVVPVGALNVGTFRVAAESGNPSVAYGCWSSPKSGALHLVRTTDGGASWSPVAAPIAAAVLCALSVDSVFGGQIVAAVQALAPGADVSCPPVALYASTNGGARWQPVPWPASAGHSICGVTAQSVAGTIYAWSPQRLMGAAAGALASSRLIATDDFGASWHALDGALAGMSAFALVAIRPGGRLLAQATPPGAGSAAHLFETADDGATWQDLGPLPGVNPQVLVSSDAATASAWTPLYVASQPADTGPLGPPILASSAHGLHWSILPSPPLGAAQHYPQLVPLGVGPQGTLLIGRYLTIGEHDYFVPPQQVWHWEPGYHRWQPDATLLPSDSIISAITWQHGSETLWLVMVHPGLPPEVDLARDTIAPGAA